MWSVRRSRGLGYTETNTGMETRLKQRLTGAAIIVALIVALVPEMFRGQAGAPPANTASSSSGEGPPVRTYTIDLSNNPKNGPLQSANEAPPASAPAASGSSSPAAPVESPPAPAPAAAVAAPRAAPSSTPPPSHGSAPAPPHATRAAPPVSSPAAAPARTATAPTGNWSVQLGLFSKRENAERMISEAKTKGFNPAIAGPDAKGQFHVHVTGLTDRVAAQAMAQKLKGEGLPAAVVAP
jgi:DedD protein